MPIYKYLNESRIQSLENATLRATQASAVNDPFELKPFFRTIFTAERLHRTLALENLEGKLVDVVYAKLPTPLRNKLSENDVAILLQRKEIRQGLEETSQAFEAEASNLLPDWSTRFRNVLFETLECNVGIVSFTNDPLSTLMWAHYAGDHKGFVIEFDETHPFFDRRRTPEDEFFHLRPVNYRLPACKYESLEDLDGVALLCTKQACWDYEQESRILIPLDNTGASSPDLVHLITFPRDCVRSVILGHRASATLENDIRQVLSHAPEYTHVNLHRASIDLSNGSIVISAVQIR